MKVDPESRPVSTRLRAAVVLLAGVVVACQQRAETFAPEPGDLLFQDLDAGPLCDAIERVTEGCRGAKFSHVGIVAHSEDARPVVIEAMPGGVQVTALPDFLGRSRDADGRPKVVVGRLRVPHRSLIPGALDAGRALLGKPYDGVFAIDNDRYYCSELVYEVFRRANGGQPCFKLAPMTFMDPATGVAMPAWGEYFRKLEAPIPEGEPGINPGSLSRSAKVEIVHAYGTPTGW